MANTRKVKKQPERTIVTDVDALIAEATFEPYKFTLGGEERELPHPRMLTYPQLTALDDDLEAALPDIVPNFADDLLAIPSFALEAVVESWLAHAGVDLGELLASARS